ncbi:MAG: AbiV family abortive infection protein [Burkholderiales bacterium]
MNSRIAHQDLAIGACCALTQSVSVLEDAAILYSQKRASSSFHLAVMAREELGRFNLLSIRHHELPTNEFVDAIKLTRQLQPHKVKLQAGQSTVPVPMSPEHFAAWQAAIERNDEAACSAISQQIRAHAAQLKPHQAAELHQHRLRAQYVDFDPQSGRWSRPSEVSMAEASTLIRTVMTEIANALLAAQGTAWIHAAFATLGEAKPDMGSFTHRIFARLAEGDA